MLRFVEDELAWTPAVADRTANATLANKASTAAAITHRRQQPEVAYRDGAPADSRDWATRGHGVEILRYGDNDERTVSALKTADDLLCASTFRTIRAAVCLPG